MAEIRPLERIRERIKEIRERIRIRPEKRRVRGEIEIGRGALVERVRKRAVEVTERIEEVKPGIIPRIGEILAAWYPGKRLVKIITPKAEIVRPGEITLKEAEKEYKPPVKEGAHY